MSTKTADRIVEVPNKIIADINLLRQCYLTEIAMCDVLEMSQQSLGRLKLSGRCKTSTLLNLELNLAAAMRKNKSKINALNTKK